MPTSQMRQPFKILLIESAKWFNPRLSLIKADNIIQSFTKLADADCISRWNKTCEPLTRVNIMEYLRSLIGKRTFNVVNQTVIRSSNLKVPGPIASDFFHLSEILVSEENSIYFSHYPW